MTVEAWLLAATTLIALVAVVVAGVSVRAVRRLSARLDFDTPMPAASPLDPRDLDTPDLDMARPMELAPRVVEGRVVVPPTQAQVVRTALGRPGVRLSILLYGLARALRAENRDRVVALMRREYRHRRRQRLRAGRQAIRAARPTAAPTTDRLHAHLVEPRPLSLTDRMISP